MPHIAHSAGQYSWDHLADADYVMSVQNLATNASVYLDLGYVVVSRYMNVAALSLTTSSSALGTALPLPSSATESLLPPPHGVRLSARLRAHSSSSSHSARRCGHCSCACVRGVVGAWACRSSRSARARSVVATSRFCRRRT
jgi:hypothetical protein